MSSVLQHDIFGMVHFVLKTTSMRKLVDNLVLVTIDKTYRRCNLIIERIRLIQEWTDLIEVQGIGAKTIRREEKPET